jgi:PIN domain nuclease of toxin-antitoxin system
MDCLLDTHAWFWLVTGDSALRPAARSALRDASTGGRVLVSIISVWEIGMLEAKGRLTLHVPCETWVETALGQPSVSLVPLGPAVAVASSRLPGAFHGDPADRILVATARALDVPIVTRDRGILAYGRRGLLKTIAA